MDEVPEVTDGYFDEAGFFILPDKSFYDPYGYFFDKDGYDVQGGWYNANGIYVNPHRDKHNTMRIGESQSKPI